MLSKYFFALVEKPDTVQEKITTGALLIYASILSVAAFKSSSGPANASATDCLKLSPPVIPFLKILKPAVSPFSKFPSSLGPESDEALRGVTAAVLGRIALKAVEHDSEASTTTQIMLFIATMVLQALLWTFSAKTECRQWYSRLLVTAE